MAEKASPTGSTSRHHADREADAMKGNQMIDNRPSIYVSDRQAEEPMARQPIPTNIDDSFVEGWYFGRFCRPENLHVMTRHNSTVTISKEYERGVYEGAKFEGQY
jgi:hypothetical protein